MSTGKTNLGDINFITTQELECIYSCHESLTVSDPYEFKSNVTLSLENAYKNASHFYVGLMTTTPPSGPGYSASFGWYGIFPETDYKLKVEELSSVHFESNGEVKPNENITYTCPTNFLGLLLNEYDEYGWRKTDFKPKIVFNKTNNTIILTDANGRKFQYPYDESGEVTFWAIFFK